MLFFLKVSCERDGLRAFHKRTDITHIGLFGKEEHTYLYYLFIIILLLETNNKHRNPINRLNSATYLNGVRGKQEQCYRLLLPYSSALHQCTNVNVPGTGVTTCTSLYLSVERSG